MTWNNYKGQIHKEWIVAADSTMKSFFDPIRIHCNCCESMLTTAAVLDKGAS